MNNFKDVFLHKQQILRNKPEKSRVEVRAESRLVEAFRSHVKMRDFELVLDQPENMGGTDQGPRPSEILLAALAVCHEVTYRLYLMVVTARWFISVVKTVQLVLGPCLCEITTESQIRDALRITISDEAHCSNPVLQRRTILLSPLPYSTTKVA